MLRMVSYPHRPLSGQITCYLNRTYHVLPTRRRVAPVGSKLRCPVFVASEMSGFKVVPSPFGLG